jgi:hypothetical protein
MRVACTHCREVHEYSARRPSFCANCGKPLAPSGHSTADLDEAEAPTQAPGPIVPEVPAADPTEVGHYRLVRPLGEGGMGRVYEAEDTTSGRRVALKLIGRSYTSSPDAVERFRREGRLASALSHPRCVFVLAADEEGGRPYIVMELMPGDTLQDLLKRRGPLPIEEAIGKILDVIDGLHEAHRLGMVHRDVKPSNCFLEPDGRVKVGDFGLAKSLVSSAALTRTGSFIGTPLFASPEQIKGEATGPQSDVYSVAATLYCLLTGKAPFQGTDAAATVARIVSDAAPPMRTVLPELPDALDRVVLRGLERDPERRWRDLAQFRAALVPFLPGQISLVGLGVRFGAYWIDHFILGIALTPISFWVVWQVGDLSTLQGVSVETANLAINLLGFLLYFGLPESLWGCSLAKLALGFRVVKASEPESPELWRSVLRASVYWTGMQVYALTLWLLHVVGLAASPQLTQETVQMSIAAATCCTLPLTVVGPALVLCTMRTRNGYRGLHEWISGTRVVRLVETDDRRALGRHCRSMALDQPTGALPQLGPFTVLAIVRDNGDDAVLVGEDPVLGRKALLWARSMDQPPLTAEQRAIARPNRLRWLTGGRKAKQQWDAFLFPAGHPLREVVESEGRLSWGETRYLLSQLTDEFCTASVDDTLPSVLTLDQIWVQSDGRAQVLDVPMAATEAEGEPLPLLADIAVLALEGKPRPAGAARDRIAAPLPEHAADILRRLVGPGKPYRKLSTLKNDLAETADNPAALNRRRRFAHLTVMATFLYFGIAGLLVMLGGWPGTVIPMMERMQLMTEEQLVHGMDALIARDVVAGLQDDPLSRCLALHQLNGDLADRAILVARADAKRAVLAKRLQSTGWGGRKALEFIEKAVEAQNAAAGHAPQRALRDYPNVTRLRARDGGIIIDEHSAMIMCVGSLCLTTAFLMVLAIFIAWAFLWRGGLTFRMFGLSLVRADGRPAGRLRCAWRAMLFWAPVAALVVGSVSVECLHWLRWQPDGDVYLAWLAWLLWWAGMALFPLYAVLAVRSPTRSLHDRLAGTYLVPR